ncbi:hypothetical protein Slin15195_G010900 [Septoria linicola]|uniref:Uncharacterized protein n=1 Tax=Septoria linicola TaxID=215465 RepID=A0A9Q9AN24_9PEZI|nr:hypothetical protein Slin14017_G010910 [Septoria linicola]USW47771.1 hypothetical protein Slin15195_G010900 [Septoria linicola]
MPSYRGIEVSLQSQHDALSLPEFTLEDNPRHAPQYGSGSFAYTPFEAPEIPAVIEAYAPVYLGSQFWIMFRCAPPVEPEVRYYYFKWAVNGKCILSWGCGQSDKFSGRIGFGIFAGTGTDCEGQPMIEKRAFTFPTLDENTAGSSFEIRVYRAKGRRREDREIERWQEGAEGDGVKVNIAGFMKPFEPCQNYAYALLDPVGKPYVSFVCHHHTSQRLREIGFDLPPEFDMAGITEAPASRKDQIVSEPLSPPPKERPMSPPGERLGKDSIVLRKSTFNNARLGQASPSKIKRDETPFDPLQGLTLGQTAQAEPSASSQMPLFPMPRSAGTSGLLGRWKRRINSRDEQNISLYLNAEE